MTTLSDWLILTHTKYLNILFILDCKTSKNGKNIHCKAFEHNPSHEKVRHINSLSLQSCLWSTRKRNNHSNIPSPFLPIFRGIFSHLHVLDISTFPFFVQCFFPSPCLFRGLFLLLDPFPLHYLPLHIYTCHWQPSIGSLNQCSTQ